MTAKELKKVLENVDDDAAVCVEQKFLRDTLVSNVRYVQKYDSYVVLVGYEDSQTN